MYIGHFAVALAAKKAEPRVSLGMLFLAVSFVDLLWPLFLLFGLEHVRIDPGNTVVTPLDFYDYPFTHSLLTSAGWSILVGGLYFSFSKNTRASIVVGLAVLSHWVLDLITHRPDLPLIPGNDLKVGLGLWNSLPGTMVVEFLLFGVGWYLYSRSTTATDRMGRIAFWSWSFFVLATYCANLFGPPPPSTAALATVGLFAWLFVPWGYWIEKHRSPSAPATF